LRLKNRGKEKPNPLLLEEPVGLGANLIGLSLSDFKDLADLNGFAFLGL
jgi:hypothetical protein